MIFASSGDKGPPWGTALRGGLSGAIGQHHSGAQVASDQAQQLPAADIVAQCAQESVVVHGFKERLQIAVNRMAKS